MIDPPYHLDARRRKIVLDSILTTCQYFNWKLFAAHVRSNHIHVVLNADVSPEIVLHRLKRYASSALNCANIDGARTKRWTRHGSTRYLWDERNVSVVMHYVVNLQGEPMAVHEDQV
jgi:REP element-mobilizing transposase RayT